MKHADVVINHPQIFMQTYMRYATGHVIWSADKHHHTSCHASQAAAGKTQRAGDGVDLQKKKCLGHLMCIFAVISDISTVVGGKKTITYYRT